ncbi:MAG TPA: toll/interleukin-1 receptor domain-containing protein [Bryobacteraceae bacterium]|nr:toll/interleukin-1 receptor domain-containing protein [Bryobacteraceae bacterium]
MNKASGLDSPAVRTVFISHSTIDKPFVFRLAFELLAEGVPVWLDSWEMGPGDPLIASLDKALDGSARVLVVQSIHAAATEWVQYEIEKSLEAEQRLGQHLIVPLRIDNSNGLNALKDRLHIDLREGAAFMQGVHALIDHLRALGLSSEPSGRAVLPLVFHNRIELDTFILERILDRWIGHGLVRRDIAPEIIHLLKNEAHNTLQRRLRARISTYWSRPDASAEGSNLLRTLDSDVVLKERDLRERSALVLREFGYGFGLSNSHVREVLRWYTRAAMHYLMTTLEAADVSEPQTKAEFYEAVQSLPTFKPEPTTAAWWNIVDPVQVRVHHQDLGGRYNPTGRILVPRTALRVREADIAKYPGVSFKRAFEFDALSRYVLPQMVHSAPVGTAAAPAVWDEDGFWLWEDSD